MFMVKATKTAIIGGSNAGVTMPSPLTGRAILFVTIATKITHAIEYVSDAGYS